MKPVHQTNFDPKIGNCMAACIASILELPIEIMPNFHNDDEAHDNTWYIDWQRWLEPYNIQLLTFQAGGDWDPTGYSILAGQSPRGEWNHAVVALNGKVVHDPHPANTGVRDRREWTVFTVYDPAKVVAKVVSL